MKRLFVIISLCWVVAGLQAQTNKQTCLYAVKDADSLYLDRYIPNITTEDSQGHPCLIFVFGGGFSHGSRDGSTYIPFLEYLAEQGIEAISIDYRLGLKNGIDMSSYQNVISQFTKTLTMAVEDLYSATGFVLQHAAEWSIDPQQIIAAGSSAGAITVLQGEYMLCNFPDVAAHFPQGFTYAGIISLAGAIFVNTPEPTWNKTPAPIFFAHGSADPQVPYNTLALDGYGIFGSSYLSRQLTELQVPHWFYSVKYQNHVMANRPLNLNRAEIMTFINKLVLAKEPLIIHTDVDDLGLPEVKTDFTLEDYLMNNYRR